MTRLILLLAVVVVAATAQDASKLFACYTVARQNL
jgi:hypothetical protein